ncbi:MAG TPA: ATP-dependent helicase, partial [Actinobacteria bacterium]|nr:ATP-dependent helicase [Actinomycetota bacterium]
MTSGGGVPDLPSVLAAAVEGIGGEPRAGQLQMARAVERALTEREHLLVQAGTGTGKSLAYLVPALLHHSTVVVATATIALQTQLVERDLPVLVEAIAPLLGRRPSFAVLKGRSNYACLNRVMDEPAAPPGATSGGNATDGPAELFAAQAFAESVDAATVDDGTDTAMAKDARRLRAWVKTTTTGDRLELQPGVDDRVWRAFSVTGRECLNQQCPWVQDCFAEHAREQAREADVVVTNHSLLAINTLENVPVLPDHDVVVVDEAHELIDRATSASTRTLAPGTIERAAQRSRRPAGRDAADALLGAAGALADALLSVPDGQIARPEGALLTALASVRDAARAALSEISAATKRGDEGAGGGVDAGAVQLAKADLDEVFTAAGDLITVTDETIAWVDTDARRQRSLHLAPLSVAGLLRESLFNSATVVLTSATLKLGGTFDALAASVGLLPVRPARAEPGEENQDTGDEDTVHSGDDEPLRWQGLDVGSPFDFARQGIFYTAADLPERGGAGQTTVPAEVIERVVELIGAAGGRTLGLFSSKWAAQVVADEVRSRIGVPLLTQWDAPLPHVIAQFAEQPRSCLFGTLSLWQGVDVPGDSCTLVIIDKLPFPRPDEPIVQARSRAADAEGSSGFMRVSVP